MALQISANDSFDQHRSDDVDDKSWSSLKTFVEEVKLLPSAGGGIDHQFGNTVSVKGNRMIVGAPNYSLNTIKHGAVYVFDFDGNKWNQSQILTPFDGQEGDGFGISVSLSANHLLIGAYHDNDGGIDSGTVFIYDFDGVSWFFTEKIQANDAESGGFFGTSVSLSGDRALIGARGASEDPFTITGAAYIFELSNNVWSQTNKLLASDAFVSDNFGISVSLLETRALIGSENNSAYIFDFDGNNWLETTILAADNAVAFGRSVSLTNNRAIIGAMGNNAGAGAAYIFDFNNNTWSQSQKLLATDAQANARFGYSVNIIDNQALVGAVLESENILSAGAAYVFDLNDNTWNQSQKLTASDATTLDEFGFSVSLTNDRLVIGARFDDSNGDNSGSVYVFDNNGSSWSQSNKVLAVAGNGEAGTPFGYSVSLSGNRALIGVPNDGGTNSASAYIFDFDGSSWNQVQKITATDATNNFGLSVSLSDNRALIGDSGINSAYIFDFNENSWNQVQKITAADTTDGGEFGWSVSLSGNRALIGAPRINTAYIFDFDGSSWNQVQKITSTDVDPDAFFGNSVSLSGNRALIGAYSDDSIGNLFFGSAYLFDFDGSSWNQVQKLTAANETVGNSFGTSVSLSGNRALIGAYIDIYSSKAPPGSAYIFDFDGVSWNQVQKITAADAANADSFGRSVSLSGNQALVGASSYYEFGANAAYLFDFDGNSWNQVQKFTAADTTLDNKFGQSVSLSDNRVLIGAHIDGDNDFNSGAAYIFTSDLIFKNSFE